MSETIRWGILATGWIADQFARDLARTDGAEAVAVGSRTEEGAAGFAGRHGIARAHGSWAELAADPGVDIVYVATPHSAHHEATAACLAAGKAVLCEKPLTLNAGQARDLVDRARDGGRFLMEAMWMFTNPAVRRALELVKDGAIGDVRQVQADFGFAAGPLHPGHRLRDPRQGGGALLDLGVYPVSLAHLFLGAPDTVQANASLTPEGVDATTGILLGHENGAVAALTCSIESLSPCVAVIGGTEGTITLGTPFAAGGFYRPDGLTLHRGDAEPERIDVPFEGLGYVHEIEEAGRCLRAGLLESPLVPWQSTLDVLTTLDTVRDRIGVHYGADTV
ncbi:scyllo-inositol 2-dehydrogenase (NADP(+)) IolU [Streptomyces sp. RB5]|uniref:Scyllo-inositol 2-dehydrogenase (NADP(+)) IolU n=1 Tax=Streptomyces smaragdinus TaxID=2585196 RepID=A0A7K0CAG8_9ACTN|nr:Gfo/Idh/MocA family oxidoreductase [Streptomyces smaragdinus]MQY10396.1 scyllo-inositol 2-dehydrogenase (NADP(+)) IolU [Streptomyces smaragdinus]